MADFLAFHPKGTSKIPLQSHHRCPSWPICVGISAHFQKSIPIIRRVGCSTACGTSPLSQDVGKDRVSGRTTRGDPVPIPARRSRTHTQRMEEPFQAKPRGCKRVVEEGPIWLLACPPTELALQSCFLDTAKLCESSGMHDAAKRLMDAVRPAVTPPVGHVF